MSVINSFDLSGKTALVTGCKRGIGRGMAEALAQAGADIVGVSASLELSGSDVENAVKALGRDFRAYQCDFGDRKALTEFAAQLESDGVKPDILINNAGMQHRTELQDFPADAFERLLQTNIASVFHVGQAVARCLHGPASFAVGRVPQVQHRQ